MRPNEAGIALKVSDVSAQKMANLKDVPREATVAELVSGLLRELNLPEQDVEGRPLTYGVRRQRGGLHLHASERVGEALLPGDHIVLQPNVDAG
jgi:hypothetical protein